MLFTTVCEYAIRALTHLALYGNEIDEDAVPAVVAQKLSEIVELAEGEFGSDSAVVHLRHCIEELERIAAGSD